jgi:hypothetical protein
MNQRHVIPAGAGLVSAITFVSVALGDPGFGVLLFIIVPLPIFLAGLGLGWQSALIAAVVASLVILLIAGPTSAGAFGLAQAMPPVILSYLALLNRPSADPGTIEWYPPGRLVVATALLGAALSFALMLGMGGTRDAIREKIAPVVEELIKSQTEGGTAPSPIAPEDVPKLVDISVALMPTLCAMTVMAILLFNLWLAGRITRASGQLARDWPDLGLLEFPRRTPLVLAAATAAGFTDGLPAMAGNALSGAMFFAYVLVGLAIIHHASRGASWRTAGLWVTYLALVFFNPALLLLALVGLVDHLWPLRRPPPS